MTVHKGGLRSALLVWVERDTTLVVRYYNLP